MPLSLQNSEGIKSFLASVIEDISLPQNVRDQAVGVAEGQEVSWRDLRDLTETLRTGEGTGRDVWLHEICRGSGVALQGPRPRAKSPALQARLAELQRKLDQHHYDTMLQGIAEKEFGAGTEDQSGMATYQAQLSLGLHILVMMGTFFAAGFYGVSYVSPEPLHHLVGGLVGLILAMLMETVLLIIRTSVSPRSKAEEILLRHDKKTQEAKLQQAREAAVRQALDPGMHRAGSDRVSADGDSASPAVPPEVKKEQ